jgi:hypothetical protein
MKDILNRHAYIFITLIPVAIYILSYYLFEINAASSLKIKTMLVAAIRGHEVSPASTIMEYQSRILWLSSSLLSITAYLIALTWSVLTIRRCCCRIHLINLAVVGLAIMVLSLLQIGRADSGSAMYNTIFDTTYQALKLSALITESLLHKVFFIISIINVLAAVTPVFILIAICSTISTPIETGLPKLEFFIKRVNYQKQGILVGSIVLFFGIIHMVAWMQWPVAMFEETELKKAALDFFAAISQFWGISFSLLLICLYAVAAIYWQAQTRAALIALHSDVDITKWLDDNGFTISWQKHALQLSAILTPFLAGSFSGGRELFSLN